MKRHIGGSRKKSILDHYDFYGNIDFCGCKHGKYQYNKLGGLSKAFQRNTKMKKGFVEHVQNPIRKERTNKVIKKEDKL